MRRGWGMVACCMTLFLGACAHARNYDAPGGPRFLGGVVPLRPPTLLLRVVTFNVQRAHALHRVGAVLRDSLALRDADIVLLQETDVASTLWLAGLLGRRYVYVPAMWHPTSRRDYGNAILSAWPIVSTNKALLPHLGRWRQSRRTATAATLCVGSTAVRVYATHLGTVTEIGPGARREQLDVVLEDAEAFPIAIVGGDFNSKGVTEVAVARGWSWPTADRGTTRGWWAVDHVVVRGLTALDAGVAEIGDGVSDHRPVWTVLSLADATPAPACTDNPPDR